jgi:hypothetical protein
MAIEKKKSLSIICENCDSEYTIRFAKHGVSGDPSHCAFCGETIEEADNADEDEEFDSYRSDDDE